MKVSHLNTPSLWFLFAGIIIFSISGCYHDVISKNISEKTPVLLLPLANDTIGSNPVQFKWDEMEGATKYHLEVVSPSFGAMSAFLIDSMITGTSFSFTLDSAQYQVRLTAVNAGYTSKTTAPKTFWIGTSAPPTQDLVHLITPSSQAMINQNENILFKWEDIPSNLSYDFWLKRVNSDNTLTTYDAQFDLHAYQIYLSNGVSLPEGKYQWNVSAYLPNNVVYSSSSTFDIDTTAPATPQLTAPLNNTIEFASSDETVFTWTVANDPGCSSCTHATVSNHIEISTDNFSTFFVNQNLSGDLNTFEKILPIGNYKWRVYRTDAAGNVGTYSEIFSLTIN
jgi:hypothetical protein